MRFFLFFLFVMLVSACSNPIKKDGVITVSLHPHKYLIDQISGNSLEVEVLVPPGADHETYDPTPAQFARLSSSSLYFANGHLSFEEAWLPNIQSNNPSLKIIDLSSGIDLIEGEGHMHGDHHHATADPHYWLSIKSMKQMAENALIALCEQYPDKKSDFEENYQSLIHRMDSTDLVIQKRLSDYAGRSFMIFHPALTYYARDYKLNQIAIEVDGKAPSLQGLQRFIDLARQNKVNIILIQAQYDKENAASIAKEAGAKVVQFDPVAYDWLKSLVDVNEIIIASFK